MSIVDKQSDRLNQSDQKTLLVIEHDNAHINRASLCAIAACQQLGAPITALVMGEQLASIAELTSRIEGIERVILADSPALKHQLAETVTPIISDLATDAHYSHIVSSASTFGKNSLFRVAGLLDVMPISDVTAIIDARTFERPIYGGNAIATMQAPTNSLEGAQNMPIVMTIRATAFQPAQRRDSAPAPITKLTGEINSAHNTQSHFISQQTTDSVNLDNANIIVSGGRGVGSRENYEQLLAPLAQKLGGALGASRPAVDGAFCPTDYLIGQTSKIVAPDVYFALGISGAIQHVNGIKDSRLIVAINSDANAPIFDVCDYGLVGDLREAVQNLLEKL